MGVPLRVKRSTSVSNRANRSKEPEPRWATQSNQLADRLDTEQGRIQLGSFIASQKASLKTKGHGKQKDKSSGNRKRPNAKGKGNDMRQDLPRASPAEPATSGG